MKKIVSIIGLILLFCSYTFGQYDCKVLIENLQDQYNGECKKGLANGEGSAKGVDSYSGKFKKGYPNGFGVYTFANGSNYIGNFRKGTKDGYGLLNTLSEAGGLVQDYGLWLADSLVIPNDPKALFKVKNRKGIKLIDPKLSRDIASKSQIWINFQVDGVPDKTVLISKVEISSGKQLDTSERSLNTLIAFDEIKIFPTTFKLIYHIQKSNHFEVQDCLVEVTLFTKGLWEININH